MTKEVISRLNKPTPKVIKKLQKIAKIIGGSGTAITGSVAMFTDIEIPKWIPFTIIGATFVNHLLLELFTEEDNI